MLQILLLLAEVECWLSYFDFWLLLVVIIDSVEPLGSLLMFFFCLFELFVVIVLLFLLPWWHYIYKCGMLRNQSYMKARRFKLTSCALATILLISPIKVLSRELWPLLLMNFFKSKVAGYFQRAHS